MNRLSKSVRNYIHQSQPEPQIVSGTDTRKQIANEVSKLGSTRAFVITSPSIATKTPLLTELQDSLGATLVGSFTDVKPHSPISGVFEALEKARSVDADCLISVGGGSSIDLTKAVAFCLAHNLSDKSQLVEYLGQYSGQDTDYSSAVADTINHIAVPTTGSAAEFTGISGVTDTEQSRKFLIVAPNIVPDTVVLDPAATVFTPENLWLSTFIRSFDHGAEALYGPKRTPMTDLLAKQAVSLIYKNTQLCKDDPSDLLARSNLQAGAWFGVTAALRAGVGLSHGLGYILGGTFNVPHGICSCVTLSHVIDWNEPNAKESISEIADAISQGGDVCTEPGGALRALLRKLELPSRIGMLSEVKETDLDKIASMLVEMPHAKTNPRQLTNTDDALNLLRSAW